MPELPEVETIRRDLEKTLVSRRIVKIFVHARKSLRHDPSVFQSRLTGCKISAVNRRAKLLLIEFDQILWTLCVHLKMTGQLIHVSRKKVLAGAWSLSRLQKGLAYETSQGSSNRLKAQELPNSWTRVVFEFDDHSSLYFNDIRRFGYLRLLSDREKKKVFANFGIEPLTENWNLESFRQIFPRRTAAIKAVLLNQKLIAGIGNIYADEICFVAGIRPSRRARRLTRKEIEKLFEACSEVLANAIASRGTSFRDYRDASGAKGSYAISLNVYGRKDRPCPNCQTPIKKVILVGRGTHYCPSCQK